MSAEGGGRSERGRPPSASDGVRLPSSPGVSAWAPLDAALAAYRGGRTDAVMIMRTDVGGDEEIPVSVFFRAPEDMGPVERTAVAQARGRILDLGAGAGAVAIPLVRAGLEVTALEILPAGRAALREGGVSDVRGGGLDALEPGERFDTVLVLMNGLGLAGTMEGLEPLLASLGACLGSDGWILADSTDPRSWPDPDDGRDRGEVHMQLEFDGAAGEPFPFLFVGEDRLREAAEAVGLRLTVLAREDDGRYLAALRFRPEGRRPG